MKNEIPKEIPSIRKIEALNFIFLRGKDSDLLLSSTNSKLHCVLYFGKKIDFSKYSPSTNFFPFVKKVSVGISAAEDLNYEIIKSAFTHLYFANKPSLGKAMLDETREISITPEHGRAFFGESGIRGFYSNDQVVQHGFTQFKVAPEVEFTRNEATSGVCISAADIRGLQIAHNFVFCLNSDVLKCSTKLSIDKKYKNNVWHLSWLAAPVFSISSAYKSFTTYYGRWIKEFQKQKNYFNVGLFEKKTVWGRTSHEHFPGIIITPKVENVVTGQSFLYHFAYSGNHRLVVEQLADGGRQLQFGENLFPSEVIVDWSNSYESPGLLVATSIPGTKSVTNKMHQYLRCFKNSSNKKAIKRRVVYNVWEAIYFNHSLPKLLNLVKQAESIGAERFVLDDGWFKGRTDDSKALGDWFVCKQKYPDGLHPLIEEVKKLQMDFGLWLEPEMVSKDSDLYRKNPQWIIEEKNYEQVIGRNQWVLNLSNPQAFDYIYERIEALLEEYDISFIKWDMNRSLALAAETNGKYVYRSQTIALYTLFKKIKSKYPFLEIESCSSGGGRIDYGVLEYADRVWLSDSNDALERARMQFEALRFIPPEYIGSHVGPRKCHTSGRIIPIQFRAWVAASCHMGYELDLSELTEEENKTLKSVTAFYKKERDFIFSADVVHLEPKSEAKAIYRTTHMYINSKKTRFLLFLYQLDSEEWALSKPVHFKNLLPNEMYTIRMVNTNDLTGGNNFDLSHPLFSESLNLSGLELQQKGLHLPLLFPLTAVVLQGKIE